MDEGKPLPSATMRTTTIQGLTLVHFSAQCKRFLWDRGCIEWMFRRCLGGVRGYQGLCRVYFVLETAQVALKTGRV